MDTGETKEERSSLGTSSQGSIGKPKERDLSEKQAGGLRKGLDTGGNSGINSENQELPSDKVSAAQAEADAALQDFLDAFNDLNCDNLGIIDNTAEKQAKMLVAGTKMVGAFTKLGIYKFADVIKNIASKGIQITEDLLSAIKKAYGAFAAENDIDELDDMKTVRKFTLNDITENKPKENGTKQQERSEQAIEAETATIESASEVIGNQSKNVGSDKQRAGEIKEKASEQIKKTERLLVEIDKRIADLRLTYKNF